MSSAIKKVVIPVAGLGTRGLPFTKEVPKELLPILDVPTIQFIVEEVVAAGIEQVIFVTSKGKSVLEDYFDPSPNLESWLRKRGKEEAAERIRKIGQLCEVISVRQKEPLGLGHAVYCARHIVGNEMFAVCLGDEIFPPWDETAERPVLRNLLETAQSLKASVVGVVQIPKSESPSYGVIDIGNESLAMSPVRIRRTVEKPKPENAPSPYAIIGRYIFEPAIFQALQEGKAGVGGEIQLTDAMDKLCGAGKLYAQLVQGRRYDIGNHFYYLKAQIDSALRRPELSQKLRQYLQSL